MPAKKRTRGERYPVEWVAAEFGVDRKTLARRLDAKGVDSSEGVTLHEAFDAWTGKLAGEKERLRKVTEEANLAEIETAEKRGTLILKSESKRLISDLAAQTRMKIEEATYIPKPDRIRLTKELAAIKVQ